MVQCNLENFKKISKSLDESINVKKYNEADILKVYSLNKTHDGSLPGFCASLVMLAKKSKQLHLLGDSPEDQAVVRQWLEYAVSTANYVDVPNVSRQVLKDINTNLSERTFVAGNFRSLADIVLYHLLHQVVVSLTFQEKEQFVHLSRWYNNLQQDGSIRGPNPLLTFSRTLLY
ncbi:eukaryotic translation elongation factor 1 epsilon-1 [Frankliniella occidentalis]|uniref:Eukaryotic translation elongation factor 1 epsilon-1 n=1 Tax=Frankliniella occidentalis TaxID=133901 RepID=A0A9C6WZ45_FRAOC|nr:eukaryotic translation elongation factor 1 epsilon-1 [Frankliniella occidentalis]